MNHFLPFKTNRILLALIFTLCATLSWAQKIEPGVKKGIVKVKFSPEMTSSLQQMTVTSRKNELVTGLKPFDATANQVKASDMYRLFPVNSATESKLHKHGLHLWYILEIDEDINPKAAAAQLMLLDEVEVAEAERIKVIAPYEVKAYVPSSSTSRQASLPFNDPLLVDQWHYDNTGQTGFSDADVNLFAAWTSVTGASDIIVSVHDEGVDVNHEDLNSNIWVNEKELNGQPGVDDDNNGYVDDIHGYNFQRKSGEIDPQYHGTHVAGTIAAINNNGIGVSGVAGGDGSGNGVKIMSLQILGGAAIEKSFVYAADNGAVISQNSWGYSYPGSVEESVLDAIDYFIAEAGDFEGSPMKGGIVIFAAGNSNYDADWYPGYYESAFAVASIGPEWKKASYSNYGTWIELSAPGGATEYGAKNGVLSTIPNDQYAYLEGTSMACPHVSGIAALALVNSATQITNTELWNKLQTGVVDITAFNPGYEELLGSGAIDAALAIKNDLGKIPATITDLAVTGIAQEFATLSWKVPADEDDGAPVSFTLYYHTAPINSANLTSASRHIIKNTQSAGSDVAFEVNDLLGLTTYYFAITSTDRWGNVSELSEVISETTNEGPSIAVDENSLQIALNVDASGSLTTSHDLTILNEAAGVLRWEYFTRHSNSSLAYGADRLNYPTSTATKKASAAKVAQRNADDNQDKLRGQSPETYSFTPVVKSYADWATNIIGETDINLSNSAATKFIVSETEGFNLTQARMYLKHDPALGPVIMEVYEGDTPSKENLIYAQEHSNWSADESWAYITLNEQLYFGSGSTFWLVFHVPAGNLFPLGIGYETDPKYSDYCFMSFDLGGTWAPLEDLLDSKEFTFAVAADSYNEHLGTYLTLDPANGDVEGNSEMNATLTANGSTLINGTYNANLVLASNDANQRELRVPVSLNVSGHQPRIVHTDIVDFGSVFIGTSETVEIVLDNQGFGNFNNPSFNIAGDQFAIDGYTPWQIQARDEVTLKLNYQPTTSGNANGLLTITNGDQTYEISLFGVGAETSEINITPTEQVVNNVTIGDVINAEVLVKNTGGYPLKYFIPGFDAKGISNDWPSAYHTYGYKYKTSDPSETNPIAYDFQDISASGVDVTETIKDDGAYYEVNMGFDFPYYGESLKTLYIAQKGFTTFDNSVRPVNTPTLNNFYSPKGYISPLGTFLDFSAQGQVFYQVEADRVIVQYHNVTDGFNAPITAQMVLHSNGDIRFYYEEMGFDSWSQSYLTILIEDLNRTDGILVHNYEQKISLYSGLALGFDYPGPNIISSIENASAILAPDSSALMSLSLNTSTLVEGTTKRYINIISNDPANFQTSALVQLEITSGGTPLPVVSMDTVEFGEVFQGAVRKAVFTVKNEGTANVNITGMAFANEAFSLTGTQPATIKPGLYGKYEIVVPTTTTADLEDVLTISYSGGSTSTIYASAAVVDPPAINADLSLVQQTLAYGESATEPFSVENTGLAPLSVTMTGKQWLSFDTETPGTSHGYAFQKYNAGEFYQWIDIRKTGTQMPFAEDLFDKAYFWRDLTLPFPVTIYGEEYETMKIGENGIVSLEEDPEVMFFNDAIPSATYDGTFIMPYWTFGGFDTYFFPEDEVGIFYQFYDDKIIITWSYLVNNFGGMGDPISTQLILYKNGSMKFQYKVEEFGSDLTSTFTAVGIQENSANGVGISNQNNLDHGSGLAYILVPAETYTVAPGTSLTGQIGMTAQNIYGGTYSESLKIQTNVPGSENLEKPVELTVTGDAVLALEETVDFGSKMIAMEWGSPLSNYLDLEMANEGSAQLEVSWAQMKSGTEGLSLQIWALVDGWFGPEWRWADISELYSPWAWVTPTFTINPGEALETRAVFAPAYSGDFRDTLVLTTNIGQFDIIMTGTGFEPPAMTVTTEKVEVVMNTMDEASTGSIVFGNTEGLSALQYEVSIDYGRAGATATTHQRTAVKPATVALQSESSQHSLTNKARTSATYNRILNHTDKEAPDTYIGIGGGAPFTLATRYNAGEQGFNISHVETWFKPEAATEGKLMVEVRAGGADIGEAILLAKGEVTFTGSGDDEVGAWHQIALEEPAGIYPNEDFYVLITYPLGIQFPQGSVTGQETVPGRYYYFDEGSWYNLQQVASFETMGWLMYAAEETAGDAAWLTITSDLNGEVAMGAESTINLAFSGALAKRGDQIAEVVITSNDPNNPEARIPVSLHMNEAPMFAKVPASLFVQENDTLVVSFEVTDKENNTYTVTPAEEYPNLSFAEANGLITLTLTPDYGDEGTYSYTLVATDEHGATAEVTLVAEVAHTNQAPGYIATEPLVQIKGQAIEYAIGDYFSDPDGDAFTFTVTSSESSIAEVFAAADKFLISSKVIGETSLTFTATDVHGAVSVETINLTVGAVMGTAKEAEAYGISVFPNPTTSKLHIQLPNENRGTSKVRLINLLGVSVMEMSGDFAASSVTTLDLTRVPTGIYFIEITDQTGTYTTRILKD